MTREERKKAIDALKISVPVMAVTQDEFNDYIKTLNKIRDLLEQEKIGHWYRISSHDTYYGLTDFKCSKCGKEISKEGDWLYEYCPRCGSPMMVESK